MTKPENRKRAEADRRLFTDANVETLKPKNIKALQTQIWDAGTGAARGLCILISRKTGTRSYRCVYYFPGSSKPHSMHLGRVGEMTLEEARRLTREARSKAEKGQDPKADDPVKSGGFEDLFSAYIKREQIGRRKRRSAPKTHKLVLNAVPQEWHQRPIGTIRKQEIDALLDLIRDGDEDNKARPYLANRMYVHLGAFFRWCVEKDHIKVSPMTGLTKPWDGAEPRNRDWFKGDAADEAIKLIWAAASKIGGDEARYVKLMLLTGKRPGIGVGLAGMRWEQIDDAWFWDAPPSGIRNKRLHGIPLPALGQRILSPHRKQGPVFKLSFDRHGEVDNADLIGRLRRMTGIADFILHGIRHLVETRMASLRDDNGRSLILPHMRDMLLDHAPHRGAGGGYDHHDYIPEMRDALEVWASHVEKLVSSEGVSLLR